MERCSLGGTVGQSSFVTLLESPAEKSQINKWEASGKTDGATMRREIERRIRDKVSLPTSSGTGNVGVAERVVTSAQLHTV